MSHLEMQIISIYKCKRFTYHYNLLFVSSGKRNYEIDIREMMWFDLKMVKICSDLKVVKMWSDLKVVKMCTALDDLMW